MYMQNTVRLKGQVDVATYLIESRPPPFCNTVFNAPPGRKKCQLQALRACVSEVELALMSVARMVVIHRRTRAPKKHAHWWDSSLGCCMGFWPQFCCRPALFGGCDVFEFIRCGPPGDCRVAGWPPFHPGNKPCSFRYSLLSSSCVAGGIIIAGPGWTDCPGLGIFSAFWAR